MTTNTIGIFIIMLLYLAAMVAIGFWFSKKNENSGDFYLGGRKLGPFVTAMSAEASDMSSWLLMGLPGVAYLSGIADAGWTALGLIAGTYLNWLIVAKRLRSYSEKIHAITIPDFFSKRYRESHPVLVAVSAIFIIIFFIPYTASGFSACGKLFSTLFGIDYLPAMIISAIVIVCYTALGGFLAASTTDLIQSIVMSVALIIVIGFGLISVGGVGVVIDNVNTLPGYLTMFQTYDSSTGTGNSYGFITILSTVAWGLGYFGMPHILLRFMAIQDKNKLKLSRRIATIWVIISMSCAIFIGIIGLTMSHLDVLDTLEGSASETVIIKIASLLSTSGSGLLKVIAIVFAGIILAGILASTMSTADSQLLAASSSISQNLMKDVLHIKVSDKVSILAARITVLVIAIISMFIARDPNSSVFQIVSFAWAGFGAVFGPAMLFSLFWKRANQPGILAGMLSGGIMVFFWKYRIRPMGGAWDIYELLPAFLVACFIFVFVSLITPKPSEEIVNEFKSIS